MRLKIVAAALAAAALPLSAASAQPKPVPTDDSPEEIARDAARDLKDSRFYNKPGATRAQYDADWQECRLIARGSRTPAGAVPTYMYMPNVSPLAAGVGGAIGGLIAGAIAEGQQRRANRRACLLIKGWRLVETPPAVREKVAAMSEAQRDKWFDTVVGAASVEGEVTERTSFTLPADPALNVDGPVSGPSSVFLGKKVDAAAPIALAPGEGAVVLAFRRPDAASAGRSAKLSIARYDVEARDLAYQPRDWKKKGDRTTYSALVRSGDKKAPYEVQVLRLTAGDYVIAGGATGSGEILVTHCFGAPTFRVGEGEVVYLGDFVPFVDVKLSNGKKAGGMGYGSHLEEARAALGARQPALAAAMKPALVRNKATYACAAVTMDRWDLPGAEALPEAEPKPLETAQAPARR